MKYRILTLAICLATSYASAQDKQTWQVDEAHGPSSLVEFSTTEGTWMNLDVSPDGQEIVFDLLGDIYLIPIEGGKAKNIASGIPYEVQPRFSPDGKKISFTSDRAGGDNIWIMNRDGSDKKQITKETFRLLNNADWAPDGQYLVARKHFTSTRSLGAGEMWMYHISGGDGIQLTKRKNDQQDAGEPVVSPDGRYVYFSEDMSGGGYFQYNKDPNGQIYMIRRYDLREGKVEEVLGGPGGAVRPQFSNDGKYLSFVRRDRLKSVLYLYDLNTGEEWPLYTELDKDQQETWAVFGVYPAYSWTPDNKHIVIWAGGKIRKVEVANGNVVTIPFEAEVKQTVVEALKFPQVASPDSFDAKMIRDAVTSPDGGLLVFNAAGYLYQKKLPDGIPVRLTTDSHFEFFPAFSRDGKYLVYASWSDTATGALHKLLLDGKSRPQRLTKERGYYLRPAFSPDGSKIVFQKGEGTSELGFAHGLRPGIYWIPSAGGEINLISEQGERPLFSSEGDRIYVMSWQNGNKVLKSYNLAGEDERALFSSKYATLMLPSPDGQWIAFNELFNVYIAAFPKTGNTVDLSAGTKAIPVKRVTRDAGTSLHWSGDSKKLHWVLGPEYFTREIRNSFDFVPGAADSIAPPDTSGIAIGLRLKTDKPSGLLAFTGARIITMKGDEVIEDGILVVQDNRITAVGKDGEINIPVGAKTFDLRGKTIIPGIVDVHAHLWNSHNGISPQQQWSYLANLAYGVTTTHDPSSNTEMVFSQSEMVKSGVMLGPRIYSTGTILYGAEGDFKAVINSIDDARSHLRRMKAVGAFSVKSYNQPRRDQRQMVIQAARELEMMVVPEGGSFFFHNMSMILDGHTGIEHAIPVSPLYNDVIRLWSGSKTTYTPTLIVGYGGIWGENYWYQKTNVWENQRLLTYTPRPLIDSRSRRRMMIPEDDFGHFEIARGCKKLLDAGTKVQLGAHGQLQGLGAHWEMWMMEQGGMTPLEALRASTLAGAEYIGLDKDLGSLEVGKLADFVVLDKNPLENIRNSEFINMVMQNGRLYEAATLSEIGNYSRKRLPFYWEYNKKSEAFPWNAATGFQEHQCGCHAAH